MIRTIIGVIILIAIIRLQIFLSKKDNRLLGLIIPIIILRVHSYSHLDSYQPIIKSKRLNL